MCCYRKGARPISKTVHTENVSLPLTCWYQKSVGTRNVLLSENIFSPIQYSITSILRHKTSPPVEAEGPGGQTYRLIYDALNGHGNKLKPRIMFLVEHRWRWVPFEFMERLINADVIDGHVTVEYTKELIIIYLPVEEFQGRTQDFRRGGCRDLPNKLTSQTSTRLS